LKADSAHNLQTNKCEKNRNNNKVLHSPTPSTTHKQTCRFLLSVVYGRQNKCEENRNHNKVINSPTPSTTRKPVVFCFRQLTAQDAKYPRTPRPYRAVPEPSKKTKED